MIRSLLHACTPAKLGKQTSAVLFGSARLTTLTRQHIGIRESPEIVDFRSGRKSIDRNKDS